MVRTVPGAQPFTGSTFVGIVGEMATLRPVPRLAPAVIENRLAEWRRLLRASTTQGRTVLQRIPRGRLTFTPRRGSDQRRG